MEPDFEMCVPLLSPGLVLPVSQAYLILPCAYKGHFLGIAFCPFNSFIFKPFKSPSKKMKAVVSLCHLKMQDFLVVFTSLCLSSSFTHSVAFTYLSNSIPTIPKCRILHTESFFDLPPISQVTPLWLLRPRSSAPLVAPSHTVQNKVTTGLLSQRVLRPLWCTVLGCDLFVDIVVLPSAYKEFQHRDSLLSVFQTSHSSDTQ